MGFIIYVVCPTRAATFKEYVSMHFIPHIKIYLSDSGYRFDAMWDPYPEQSQNADPFAREIWLSNTA